MKKNNIQSTLPIFLIIIGNVASGKSTATHILSKKLKLPVIEADTLFQTTNPYREDFLKDMPRWALINELWMTVNRVEILSSYQSKKSSQIVLVDSGLLMSWAYTFAHHHDGVMSDRDWQLYQQIFNVVANDFLSNIRVLYLNYPVPVLMERIAKRGRRYELDYYTSEYVTCLGKGLTALVTKLKNKIPIVEFGPSQADDFESSESNQHKLIDVFKTIRDTQ